ncbi:MAG: hypothetical protein CME25_05315 [Gemmatimonadetes bacterium]|nr:hypothetical protein [Gemmatimonadota bacterium]
MLTRLGVVSYFNTRPLVHALETGEINHQFQLHFDVPSVCAEKLHCNETDVALIPSIEIARSPEPYVVVSGAGISSAGPVRSVLLVHEREPSEIRTLALDIGSRTSVALGRIILHREYACTPETFQSSPDLDDMLAVADAALIIGDAALEQDLDGYRYLDLGQAWTNMTGLPFVYACWTGRGSALESEQVQTLVKAKESGVSNIPSIAETHAVSAPYSASFYRKYLSENIRFDLGDREREGLERFYSYAFELGLIDRVPRIDFFL